jgi:hypothetical protein
MNSKKFGMFSSRQTVTVGKVIFSIGYSKVSIAIKIGFEIQPEKNLFYSKYLFIPDNIILFVTFTSVFSFNLIAGNIIAYIHPLYGGGVQTHNLSVMSPLP